MATVATPDPTSILVSGATGYVGGRLIPRLLDDKHQVVCLVRPRSNLDRPFADSVTIVSGSADSADDVARAARGCRIAFYLIHSLGRDDFAEHDRRMAESFRVGCERAGVERIIYLGGLGRSDDDLSPHLASRQEVGRVLGAGSVDLTEIRAAIIIGSGSASFEMLRSLTETLPIMITPRWVQETRCQPVAIRDVLTCLQRAVGRTGDGHEILELGGPDELTYQEMMQGYAAVAGLRRRIVIRLPVLSPSLSARWVTLVTPLPGNLARQLVDSLINDVVVTETSATGELGINPIGFRHAVQRTLQMVSDLVIPTRWTGSSMIPLLEATPNPEDPEWASGSVLEDIRCATSSASSADLFRVISGIGGDNGWLTGNWMWRIRGLADKVVGGVGLRRGRRHPLNLAVGDAVDFWRVDSIDADRFLRLRAEMKMPGHAWLEWRISAETGLDSASDESAATIQQAARFVPKGALGRAYWYALVPFHQLIFPRMLSKIVEAAEDSARAAHSPPVREPVQ